MPIVQREAALAFIDECLALLRRERAIYDQMGHLRGYRLTPGYMELDDQVRERVPALIQIASEVDQAIADRIGSAVRFAEVWEWSNVLDGTVRLRGAITQSDFVASLSEPQGPQLAAARLHEWVWSSAARLWSDGHPRAAVQTASSHVESQLRAKIDRHDIGEATKLPGEAFTIEPPAPGRPRLRLPNVGEEGSARWKSAHEGAMFFGRGCFQGIRNLATHGTAEIPEQEALEYLAALSVFARWVDASEVEEASP